MPVIIPSVVHHRRSPHRRGSTTAGPQHVGGPPPPGPTRGGAVRPARLADGVVASERATFSTPFARLGVTPEGCSSVTFAEWMGAETAERMLGEENWTPGAAEARTARPWLSSSEWHELRGHGGKRGVEAHHLSKKRLEPNL